MDPVELLPPEVSSEILAYAALANPGPEGLPEVVSVDLLLDFTLISHTWQALMITTPGLWADVVISLHKHDPAAKIAIQCELSREYPLSLTIIADSAAAIEAFLPLLGDHWRRVQELVVELEEILEVLMRALGPLPSLTSLQIRSLELFEQAVNKATRAFIDQHPKLKDIRGVRLDRGLITSTWLHCLKTIYVHNIPLDALSPYLDALSSAKKVTFCHSRRGTRAPESRLLSCEINFDILSRLLSHLPEFICLVELNLSLFPGGMLRGEDRAIKSSLVQRLTISMRDDDDKSFAYEHFSALLWVMETRFPNATYLRLSGPAQRALAPRISKGSLPRLHKLSLTTSRDGNRPDFGLLSTIKVLELQGEPWDLAVYQSGSIRELEITENPLQRIYNKDLGSPGILWPRLSRLCLSGCRRINWMGPKMNNLSSIALTIGGAPGRTYQATELLYILGLHPGTFPSLKKLELVPIVEWDMLFCCLEEYGAQMKESRSHLETIVFNGEVPFGFPELISRILRGQKVERPSNHDLSWVGNLEPFRDPNV
ncbi:hypothetical protein PIIN_09096 [Serendipita indica DSM 11827]|uniref:F-box domain-containing protein n=1 Tax=Serendipita indica (strain DSM 11827) TaxID=1109443 RepID=G4TUW9_SERID|nr:hypothetical protein PIIN_09096 [Serendipita indica DSM 11827]